MYYHLFGIISRKREVLSIEIYEVVYVLSTLISIQLFRQISKRRTCTTQVLMLSLKTK